MRKFVIPVAVSICAAAVAVPAIARPSQPSSATSSIAIASVDGTVLNAATTLSPSTNLGDTLTFATTVGQLSGNEYPMAAVDCYQDVNGDGVVDMTPWGPDIVYSELSQPSATFTLGGAVSIWTERGGGSAVCRAELDAYGWKGGQESIRLLAATNNWTSAG